MADRKYIISYFTGKKWKEIIIKAKNKSQAISIIEKTKNPKAIYEPGIKIHKLKKLI